MKAKTPTPKRRKPAPSRAPASPAKRRAPSHRAPPPLSPTHTLAARQLFWHNVIREILTSLSAICTMRPAQPTLPEGQSPPEHPPAPEPHAPAYDPDLFDGRLAVMTTSGERVAIADVFPLFACGINHPGEQNIAHAVECSVFQIRTPGGQVYTLPLHEIRSFHALTPELMSKLENAERRRRPRRRVAEQLQPFGFAAYTSLLQGLPDPIPPAPEHPTE